MSGKRNGDGRRRHVSDEEIAAHLSMQYRIPTIKLDEYEIDRSIIDLVPEDLCRTHTVIPVSRAGSSLIVAMADPKAAAAIDALKLHTGLAIEPVIASESAIMTAIAKYYLAER